MAPRKFEYYTHEADFYNPTFAESRLNLEEMGRQGWELIAVTTTKDAGFVGKEHFYFYLKREIL